MKAAITTYFHSKKAKTLAQTAPYHEEHKSILNRKKKTA